MAHELGVSAPPPPASPDTKRVTIGGRESYAPRDSAMEMSFSATRLKPGGSLANMLGHVTEQSEQESSQEPSISEGSGALKAHFYKRSRSGKYQKRKFALRTSASGLELLYLDALGETNAARVLGASVTNPLKYEFDISTHVHTSDGSMQHRTFRLRAAQSSEVEAWMAVCAKCVGPALPQTSTKAAPAPAPRAPAPLNQRGERKCLNILNVFFSLAVLVLTVRTTPHHRPHLPPRTRPARRTPSHTSPSHPPHRRSSRSTA